MQRGLERRDRCREIEISFLQGLAQRDIEVVAGRQTLSLDDPGCKRRPGPEPAKRFDLGRSGRVSGFGRSQPAPNRVQETVDPKIQVVHDWYHLHAVPPVNQDIVDRTTSKTRS